MPNLEKIYKGHNKTVLEKNKNDIETTQCNCRDKSKCPLQGKCLTPSICYRADVKVSHGKIYPYIGLTEPPFKTRWHDHNKTFKNPRYRNCTELSKLIWDLKDKNIHYTIDWKIITRCASYKAWQDQNHATFASQISFIY